MICLETIYNPDESIFAVITTTLTVIASIIGLIYKNKYSKKVEAINTTTIMLAQLSDLIDEIVKDLDDDELSQEEVQRLTEKIKLLKTSMDSLKALCKVA
jgi:polyhydroxyalkanoate synthesis regulator phasin